MSPAQLQAGTVYLRLKKRIAIAPGSTVTLADAARYVADPHVAQQLGALTLYRHRSGDGNRYVIDLLHVVQALRTQHPDLTIETYGEPQVLVYVSAQAQARRPRLVVLLFSWLLLFFGAGLAIMNFHADVSMQEVQVRLTELVTGRRSEHPLWFQIPYSLGIGLGMMLFFNHLFRKKLQEEPNPLEVEMHLYEENVDTVVIAEELQKKPGGSEPPGQGTASP